MKRNKIRGSALSASAFFKPSSQAKASSQHDPTHARGMRIARRAAVEYAETFEALARS